ncbi:MAG: hypothetical protein ACRC5Q_04875, partial [Culicoidibacterales bacterium]
MRDNKNKNKYFLFSGCAIIALFFFVVINVQGNTVICSEINFETFNHYTLFFKYQGGRTVVGCESENIDQSTKINANFLYHLTDLGKELALFGEDDLVLIDKLTGTITESIGAIELGSIQKVTVIDDAVAIITNEGMSTKNDQNYGSRMIWNESYIQSNGGLILTAIQREGYIYTIERNFSTNYRHLYQYDHAGNFLGELDVDFTLSLSETNMVLDTQNNIISSYHNIITVVTSNDEVIQFPILESESFFG